MYDVNAFERQVADEAQRMAGPSKPVDDTAIFTAITATTSLKWRFLTMFSATRFFVAGAIMALFGGFLIMALPAGIPDNTDAGAAVVSDPTAPTAATSRESVAWGSKRIYYVPPSGLGGSPSVSFGTHDVARVAPEACAAGDSFVEVGPTAEDLTEALSNLTGQGSSGPVDVMVGAYPAKRFAVLRSLGSDPPGCPRLGEGYLQLWENQDGTGFGTADGGFEIVVVADVEGERLVFAASPFHGPYKEPVDDHLAALDAHADALVASIEIVDPDPLATAWVTGTVSGGAGGHVSSEETTGAGKTRSRYQWDDMRITMSDPRLSGTISAIYDQDVYSGAAGDLGTFLVGSGTYRIENEGGTWEGPNLFLNEGASGTATVSDTGLLIGTGAYEGLSAFLVFDMSQRPGTVVGAVFPGEMPPVATFE